MFSDLIFAYDAMMNAANLSSKVNSNLFTVRSDKSALNTKLSFKTLDELSVMLFIYCLLWKKKMQQLFYFLNICLKI